MALLRLGRLCNMSSVRRISRQNYGAQRPFTNPRWRSVLLGAAFKDETAFASREENSFLKRIIAVGVMWCGLEHALRLAAAVAVSPCNA
ncbi:hypothetical protein EVAR_44710_1 [Eumeta japonica]|uniref:Uncharacterized protein n=1 Tax=Eumeta variegata TaxID=151549 RepID=A0A4C1XKW2_EUMVA|nr:hypothetical protein EVAR_44710_1 [Eumeta japonica]